MEVNTETDQEYQDKKTKKAKKMLLIIAIVSIIMMFSGLTSAYIVSRGGAAFWVNIKIPPAFWVSTVFMLCSSVTMIIATIMAKRGNKLAVNIALFLSLVLGLFFVKSQFQGWNQLADRGLNFAGDNFLEHLSGEYGEDYYITNGDDQIVDMRDGHFYDPDDPTHTKTIDEELTMYENPAASYMNFLTFIHAAHVGGGLLYLIYLLIVGLLGRLGVHNSLKVSQGATYWHFVDLLWIYLLLFLHFIH